MKCKCPACGAQFSLDVLVQHDNATEALARAFQLNGELGKALIKYLGLFRPNQNGLTMDRVASLLNQLLPDMQSQRIMRHGKVIEAPISCWLDGLNAVLEQRHSLKLPLKSHGYLYEIMSHWQGKRQDLVVATPTAKAQGQSSKTASSLARLEAMKHGA